MKMGLLPWLLALLLGACAVEQTSPPPAELRQELSHPYTRINSNNGAPLCQKNDNGQCRQTTRSGCETRHLRSYAMSRGDEQPDTFYCAGRLCTGPGELRLNNCTQSGDHRCTFYANGIPQGTARFTDECRSGWFTYGNGSKGFSNPAGPVYWLETP